jgi:hypothetical protein
MKEPFLEGSKESAKRRSQRLLLQVTVFIRGTGKSGEFTEETRTLVVNAHGALLTLAASVQKGQTLHMKNKATGEEQACRVAYAGTQSDGVAQVGLEFIEPRPDFWRITFPPEDWASTASGRRIA